MKEQPCGHGGRKEGRSCRINHLTELGEVGQKQGHSHLRRPLVFEPPPTAIFIGRCNRYCQLVALLHYSWLFITGYAWDRKPHYPAGMTCMETWKAFLLPELPVILSLETF